MNHNGGTWMHALGLGIAILAAPPAGAHSVGSFVSVGKLMQPRFDPVVTPLKDGTVLVAGGMLRDTRGEVVSVRTAEQFDPITGQSIALSPLAAVPQRSVLLQDGHALVLETGDFRRAELFDPATKRFISVGRTRLPREGASMTSLPDGRVLIAGGWAASTRATAAELFDPADAAFTLTGAMGRQRYHHAAVPLPDGRVVLLGGFGAGDNTPLRTVEVFDPKTGGFTGAGQLAEPRGALHGRAALLTDGRILVWGGLRSNGSELVAPQHAAEIYDPVSGQSSVVTALDTLAPSAAVVALPDGRVLLAGGDVAGAPEGPELFRRSVELFDPATSAISSAAPLLQARSGASAVLLPDGRPLILGGITWTGRVDATDAVELFIP